jgi:serine/threonine protein kinase
MTLDAGTRLGPYIVGAPLGAGGMGEVYRARDTKLNRDVALKVLPAAVAGDPGRLARFRREAQVLAALNHPNIAQIYGLEEGPATAGGSERPASSPTMTSPAIPFGQAGHGGAVTAMGVILGTASYMSPEQAKGRSVDKRADSWALGCVCYERLTGRSLFAGETVSERWRP